MDTYVTFTVQIFMLFLSCLQILAIDTVYLDEQCNGKQFYADPSIRLKASKYSTLNRNMNCSIVIMAAPTEQLVATIRSFSTTCSNTQMDIYDGIIKDPKFRIPGSFCGFKISLPKTSLTSTLNAFLLEFSTGSLHLADSFDIIFTTYHDRPCINGDFSCSNNRCIDDSLECNGYDNCGDDSDEFVCNAVVLGAGIIAAIVVGSFLFVVCLPVIVVFLICKRRRRLSYGTLN